MKKLILLLIISITILSCKLDDNNSDNQVFVPKFKFTFNWNGETVNLSDFNDIKYTNKNGEQLSITRLRYLLSNIILVDNNNAETNLAAYNLVDLTNQEGLEFTSSTLLSIGEYNSIKFTVGFNGAENTQDAYSDLNIVSWNWPEAVGNGYHIMQYEGEFIDTNGDEQVYMMHMGTRRVSMNPNVFEPNHFNKTIDLPSNTELNANSEIEIKMNIAEWFKNPNTWDLNVLNAPLMPVYQAQVMMHENGNSVFSVSIN